MSSLTPETAHLLSALFTAAPDAQEAAPAAAGSPAVDPAAPAGPPALEQRQGGSGPALGVEAAMGSIANARQETTATGQAALDQLDAGAAAGLKAVSAQEKADLALVEAKKPVYEQRLAQMDQFNSQLAASQAAIKSKSDAAFDRYLTAVNDYKQTKIYSWWGEAATGQKVLGVISQMLAGGLAGATGNFSTTPLDKIINDDMQMQQMRLQQKGQVVGQAQSLYSELKAALKDDVSVKGALRDIAYNSFAERLANIANTNGSMQAKAVAEKGRAAIIEALAKGRADTMLQIGTQHNQQYLAEAGLTESFMAMFKPAAGSNLPKTAIPGLVGSEYLSEEHRAKIEPVITGAEEAHVLATQLQKLISKSDIDPVTGKPTNRNPAEQAKARGQVITDIKALVHKIYGLRGDQATMEKVETQLGTSEDWLDTVGAGMSTREQLRRLDHFKSTMRLLAHGAGNQELVMPDGRRVRLKYKPDETGESSGD